MHLCKYPFSWFYNFNTRTATIYGFLFIHHTNTWPYSTYSTIQTTEMSVKCWPVNTAEHLSTLQPSPTVPWNLKSHIHICLLYNFSTANNVSQQEHHRQHNTTQHNSYWTQCLIFHQLHKHMNTISDRLKWGRLPFISIRAVFPLMTAKNLFQFLQHT
jgi:hypothetical protein